MPPVRVRRHTRRRRPSTESVVFRLSPVDKHAIVSSWGTVGGKPAHVKGGFYGLGETEAALRRGAPAYSAMESAVSTLDDLLDFGVVPPTALRLDPEEKVVSVQEQIPNAVTWGRLSDLERAQVNRMDLMKIAVIDIIVHQADRHGGNLLVTPDNHAHAIDNEFAFGMFRASVAIRAVQGEKIPKTILRKLKELQKEDFVSAFAGATTMEKIEKAWERKLELERTGGRIPE